MAVSGVLALLDEEQDERDCEPFDVVKHLTSTRLKEKLRAPVD